MSKISSIILIAILMGLSLSVISCTPEACFEETNSFLKASFYDNDNKKLKAPDSITVYGLNKETIKIYDKAFKVQPALFPLNASTDNCTFIIRINGITDTITFRYSSYPHLISKECGYTFYHYLDTAKPFSTKNAIDFIYRSNGNITTSNEENIRIFY